MEPRLGCQSQLFAFVGLIAFVRRRRWEATYVVLVGLGMAGILAVIEGNVGTLVRHRAMLIPFAVIIAGHGIVRAQPLLSRMAAAVALRSSDRGGPVRQRGDKPHD